MNVEERNELAMLYVTNKLLKVLDLNEDDFKSLSNYEELSNILKDLIEVKSKGFRGLVTTALTGMHLDSSYNPLTNFYGCKPRAIFEQGIYYAFEDKIPCGKSDPLNVAKNTNVLDYKWAEGKRPQKAANAVVNYLKVLEKSNENDRTKIIDFFFYRLLQHSTKIASMNISMPKITSESATDIAEKLSRFTLEYPESGTIPQKVISLILQKIFENSQIEIEGGDESVFGTNTTSKKPADIWTSKDGNPQILYEITVKKVDKKRLDDCIDSLNQLSLLDKQVNFICRVPEDISSLNVDDRTLTHKGKMFNFYDITEFIKNSFGLLTTKQIDEILTSLRSFVMDINRAESTKVGWNKYFKCNQ